MLKTIGIYCDGHLLPLRTIEVSGGDRRTFHTRKAEGSEPGRAKEFARRVFDSSGDSMLFFTKAMKKALQEIIDDLPTAD